MSRADLEATADIIADAQGIPRAGLRAMIARESSWNPNAVGVDGEMGLMQLLPPAIADTGITGNPFDPSTNIRMGATYLRLQYERFGSWRPAIAAYNWGPGNVSRALRLRGSAWEQYAPSSVRAYIDAVGPSFGESAPGGGGGSGGGGGLLVLILLGLLAWKA